MARPRSDDRRNAILSAATRAIASQGLGAATSTDEGSDTVAELCASQPLTMLINNAGVAHYMPMAELPAEKARALLHVKVVAPTMLTRAALSGMIARGRCTIVNVAGMRAFFGPAPASPPQGQRVKYTAATEKLGMRESP